VDEPDYDARLGAYAELMPETWAGLGARRALPLLHAALADLRRPEDLALRHAASQARGGARFGPRCSRQRCQHGHDKALAPAAPAGGMHRPAVVGGRLAPDVRRRSADAVRPPQRVLE
jgi:hypothetical protein